MTPQDDDLLWTSDPVAPDALASVMNDAMRDGAIAAAAARSITVGALDKKTLIGGAVGL